MKYLIRALAASALVLGSSPALLVAGVQAEDATTSYSFVGNADLHHVRYPETDGGNYGSERTAVGVNWVDGTGNFVSLDDPNASWVRLVLRSEEAAHYEMPIEYKAGTCPLRVYINSESNYKDIQLPDGGWQVSSANIGLDLEQGDNVIVIAMAQWGGLRTFTLPSGLSLVRHHSGEAGTYALSDIAYQAAYLSGMADAATLFDPAANVEYGTLAYDTSRDYQGAAIAFITPAESHPSLDVKIRIASKANGTAYLGYAVGTGNVAAPRLLDLSSYQIGEEIDVHLPSYDLAEMGYVPDAENYVRITNETSGAAFQVLEIKESSQVDDDPSFGLKTIEADELKGMVHVRGRSLEMDGAIPLDWSASGLDFVFDGAGDVVMNLDIDSNNQNTAFVVEVDGVAHRVVAAARTLIASFEETGRHEISVYKTSEAAGNLLSVSSMEVDENATISKPAAKTLKFEFVGDSITCANQTASGVEDAYEGFARRLSAAYDADFDVVSVSGRGLMEGYNSEDGWAASKEKQMKDLYDYESFFRDPTARHTVEAGEEPDVVFVGLGGNDLGAAIMSLLGTSIDDFTSEVVAFAGKLRGLYPQAKILFSYGTFVNRDYVEEYRAAVEGLGDPGIAFLEFPQMMLGDSGHPNELNHDRMAAMMSEATSQLLGVEDPYVPEYRYEVYEAENAVLQGGSITTVTPLDGQYWSGLGYVGSMGFDNNNPDYPHSVDEIKGDMSNVSYIDFTVEAPLSGRYELRVGLATSVMSNFGIKVDGQPWSEHSFTGTDWCGGHGIYYSTTVDLVEGTHHIYLTSSLNEGGWVNYDYIVLVEEEPLADHAIAAADGTGYRIEGCPEKVLDGDGFSFEVSLEENYSQSEISVYANDVLLTEGEGGSYYVDNVQSDVEIRVEGVSLNVWEARFYILEGDDEPFAVTQNEVGSPIVLPTEEPVRDGYVFDGWDVTFESQPNGNVGIYAKWRLAEEPSGGSSDSSLIEEPGSSNPSSSEGQTVPEGNGGMSGGEIAAIVGGVVGGILVIAGGSFLLAHYLKKRKQ